MSEKNMALLSQSEIDALIKFLNDNNNAIIRGDILSQNCINKLIELVKSLPSLDRDELLNKTAFNTDICLPFSSKNGKKGYQLTFDTNEYGQISIFAINENTDDVVVITPAMVSKGDTSNLPLTWGNSISPNTFHRIANLLGLGYSKETISGLKALFAERMYGSADAVIPAFYLP